MLDNRIRAVLARLEEEDAAERAAGVARELRSRQVPPATGRFLFSVVAPQTSASVLEIGGSRGYSTIWLAAAARILGGTVVSLESDPVKCKAWQTNVDEAGLGEWAQLVKGDAFETLEAIEDVFDVVFLDAEKADYEALFALARETLEPGALVIADNVLSDAEVLHAYSTARQADVTLISLTIPLDRGLELSVVLSSPGPHSSSP